MRKLDLGSSTKFLGIEIKRDTKNKINFIKILKKFEMNNCKPVCTPMITRDGERKAEKEIDTKKGDKSEIFPYREAVGSLLYLANERPDITFAVNAVIRKQINNTNEGWVKVKQIFRYLKVL